MKRLLLIAMLTSQPVYAIGNCYVYSQWPDQQAQCEREYLARQAEWKDQQDQFNQIINQTKQDQQNAQAADFNTQLMQLLQKQSEAKQNE